MFLHLIKGLHVIEERNQQYVKLNLTLELPSPPPIPFKLRLHRRWTEGEKQHQSQIDCLIPEVVFDTATGNYLYEFGWETVKAADLTERIEYYKQQGWQEVPKPETVPNH